MNISGKESAEAIPERFIFELDGISLKNFEDWKRVFGGSEVTGISCETPILVSSPPCSEEGPVALGFGN